MKSNNLNLRQAKACLILYLKVIKKLFIEYILLDRFNMISTNYQGKIKLFDLHNDLLTSSTETDKQNFIKKNQKSGYRSIYALFKGERTLNETLEIYEKAKKVGVKYFAFEDACYLDENPDNESIAALFEKIAAINPLYVSLCWNYENTFAFGAYESVKAGLKSAGVKFIEKLNLKNIPIDTAHINEYGFYEILDIAKKTLCSHTAFDFVFPHRRNINDAQIKALISRGGIIGLICAGHFLTEQKFAPKIAAEAFFKSADFFIQKYGENNLAIGSDFFGSDYLAFKENYAVFYEELTETFLKRNISEKFMSRFFYKNAVEFFNL